MCNVQPARAQPRLGDCVSVEAAEQKEPRQVCSTRATSADGGDIAPCHLVLRLNASPLYATGRGRSCSIPTRNYLGRGGLSSPAARVACCAPAAKRPAFLPNT